MVSFPDSELQQDQGNANAWLIFGGTDRQVELAVTFVLHITTNAFPVVVHYFQVVCSSFGVRSAG